ncbi:copper homeostasis periplasmic binding protein CopC [Ralstonia holmesii]|uniref:Protein YobA n=1 Tax=Ralstonia holmesii TaxID=3058602 RepID=A0ABC8QGB2_9RALS|nr:MULTISPECIES: copper homeostasis periplasmic binding protein CopC [Ralstonia]CAJ0700303.1 Protein YobA [Ralstonia sp. LMG 32967]CAJ0801444.1 Protein YobA [Ralstonia sp. LMG 32967]CAJ0811850.1 Protein YobA [Ralstonia sp. LMG 32967]
MNARLKQSLLSLTAAIAIAPTIAFAHGKLESTEPAAGSTVATLTSPLRMSFNEELEPAFSTAHVTDAKGKTVTTEKAKVDSTNPRVLTVAVPRLAAGTYSVNWAVMTHDGHKTKGQYSFTVK